VYQNFKNCLVSFYLSVLCLMGTSTNSFCQNDIDSLEQLLQQKKGIEQLEIYYELTFQYLQSNNMDKSLWSISQAQAISMTFGDSLKMIKTGRVKGQILRRLDRTTEAISAFLEVLSYSEVNKAKGDEYFTEYVAVLNGLAIAYTFQANYDKALHYNFESLIAREEEGKKYEISVALNNIGLVYFKLKNYEKALEYYTKALEFLNESGSAVFKDKLLINIGLCYNQINNEEDSYAKAQQFIKDGLALCEPNCDNSTVMEGKFGLGKSNFGLENYQDATNHYSQSLQLAQELNDKRFQLENLVALAEIKILTKKENEAKMHLEEAESIVFGTEYNELAISIYKHYSKLFNQLKDFENAARYQEKYITVKDSTYSDQLIKNLASVQANYEERANLLTIQEKDENIRLQNELISRQRTQYIFIVVVTILIASLAGVLVWANRRQQKHNNALSEAKRIIERQNKELIKTNEELDIRVREKTIDLVDSNTMLQDVNEELDNYIYRTAHDIRGPLVTLKGVCNVAQMDVKDPLALDYLKRLDLTAEKLNSILTRLLMVSQINHAVLVTRPVNFNLIMQEVLRKIQHLPARMKIEYSEVDNVVLNSDPDLVAIVLENLVNNAIKFYNTSDRIDPFIKIEVGKYDTDHVMMSVEDNGIGIEAKDRERVFHLFVRASERSETGGIGLYLTKLSAHKLGGEIFLMHTTEKGSKFLVLFPSNLQPILAKRDEDERDRLKVKEMRDKAATETGGTDALERYYSSKRRSK
jgi:signal transduction histidine kinase